MHSAFAHPNSLARSSIWPAALAILLHERHGSGAAGKRFETKRTGAGKHVEAPGALNLRGEPVKQGFAHAVTGGPDAFGRDRDTPAPQSAPYDSHGTAVLALFACGHKLPLPDDPLG